MNFWIPQRRSKLWELVGILPRSPKEFGERVSNLVEHKLEFCRRRPRYATHEWNSAISGLSCSLTADLNDILKEAPLKQVEEHVCGRLANMPADAPFEAFHNGDLLLGRLSYAMVRALRPQNVVETGVCYGVTTSFLLQALEVNGIGLLHSIDLPPLGRGADRFVGSLVPDRVHSRWRLHRGSSRDLLPGLLATIGSVGVFVHDSLHTYRNILRELQVVQRHLAHECVVLVDDIERNAAFQRWVSTARPRFSTIVREQGKPGLMGVAVLSDAHHSV